jgi:beta-lactamase class A
MNAICDAQVFDTTWYVKDLKTGAEAGRGGDVVVPSASTRKTSIQWRTSTGMMRHWQT